MARIWIKYESQQSKGTMLCGENALYLGQAVMFQCGQSIFSDSGLQNRKCTQTPKGLRGRFLANRYPTHLHIQLLCEICFRLLLRDVMWGHRTASEKGETPAGNGLWKGLTHQKSATGQRSPPCRAGTISWSRKKVCTFWKFDGVSTSHPVKPQRGWSAAACTFMFPEAASIFSLYSC